MLLLVLYVGLVYGAALIAALLATGPRWRRGAAVLLVAAGYAVPFLAPTGDPTFRAFVALGSLWFTARTVELLREPKPVPTSRRIWHVLGLVDTLRARRMTPRVDTSALIRLLVCAPLVAAGWAGVSFGSYLPSGAARLAVRWSAGVVLVYTGVETVVALVILLYGLLGVDPRPLHDDPIRSRTITEFWSRRWNRAVHRFLKQTVFAPVARRGRTGLGLVLTFLMSAFIHFAFMLPAVGLFWAGMMGAFFVLQLPFLWAERALGVNRWPGLLARAWTLGLLLVSSPLFVEPALQIVDSWSAPRSSQSLTRRLSPSQRDPQLPSSDAEDRRVVIEAEGTKAESWGSFTLKVWNDDRTRSLIISGVTFP
ncbi:MAG: MBOAT family O-acyltransferase [Hyalangium sp.]|uniref:MBOAT family O-acyltransferase n=1 Tax=Hyalangium sp. TaxID=2028555 RepID=UPI00389A8C0B